MMNNFRIDYKISNEQKYISHSIEIKLFAGNEMRRKFDAVIKRTTVDTENTLARDHPVIKRGGNETKSRPTLTNRLGKIAINLFPSHTVIQSRRPL